MKILLAVDDSQCSRVAINSVAARPWPANSEIEIVTSVEFPHLAGAELRVLPDWNVAQLINTGQERVEAFVKRTMNKLRAAGKEQLTITGKVLAPGDVKALILAEAERWGADLIVVGSHGRHGFQRFWLGSVSQAIAERAPCSVEIVRCPTAGSG